MFIGGALNRLGCKTADNLDKILPTDDAPPPKSSKIAKETGPPAEAVMMQAFLSALRTVFPSSASPAPAPTLAPALALAQAQAQTQAQAQALIKAPAPAPAPARVSGCSVPLPSSLASLLREQAEPVDINQTVRELADAGYTFTPEILKELAALPHSAPLHGAVSAPSHGAADINIIVIIVLILIIIRFQNCRSFFVQLDAAAKSAPTYHATGDIGHACEYHPITITSNDGDGIESQKSEGGCPNVTPLPSDFFWS